ncbi:unnamed protein product, partial [Colletotrichum noveboracense]
VAIVADEGYGQLEVPCFLEKMVPLLRTPSDNGHATLITMLGRQFGTISRTRIASQRKAPTERRRNSSASTWVSRFPRVWTTSWRSISCALWTASSTMIGYQENEEGAQCGGAVLFTLFLRPGEPGVREKFDRKVGGGLSSLIGYLEWQRF